MYYTYIPNTRLSLPDYSRPSLDIQDHEDGEDQKRISFTNFVYKLPFDQRRYSKFGQVQIYIKMATLFTKISEYF